MRYASCAPRHGIGSGRIVIPAQERGGKSGIGERSHICMLVRWARGRRWVRVGHKQEGGPERGVGPWDARVPRALWWFAISLAMSLLLKVRGTRAYPGPNQSLQANQIREKPERAFDACRQLPIEGIARVDEMALAVLGDEQAATLWGLPAIVRLQ